MTNNKNPKSNTDSFELVLFNSLKSYGYLFPDNIADVEKFEKLYGNTEIEVNDNIDFLSKKEIDVLPISDYNFSLNIAAFVPKENDLLNLNDNDLLSES